MDDLLKRKGKFTISNDVIRSAGVDGSPLLRLFAKMVVVRAESDFMTGGIEYHAYSPLCRPVDEPGVVPEYQITFDAVYVDDQIEDYKITAVEAK